MATAFQQIPATAARKSAAFARARIAGGVAKTAQG